MRAGQGSLPLPRQRRGRETPSRGASAPASLRPCEPGGTLGSHFRPLASPWWRGKPGHEGGKRGGRTGPTASAGALLGECRGRVAVVACPDPVRDSGPDGRSNSSGRRISRKSWPEKPFRDSPPRFMPRSLHSLFRLFKLLNHDFIDLLCDFLCGTAAEYGMLVHLAVVRACPPYPESRTGSGQATRATRRRPTFSVRLPRPIARNAVLPRARIYSGRHPEGRVRSGGPRRGFATGIRRGCSVCRCNRRWSRSR